MRRLSIELLLLVLWLTHSGRVSAQTPPLWRQYVQARAEGTEPLLPDFSYAGYHFSEQAIPDVADRPRFDVTEYGAVPDDEAHDDQAIQRAIEAAEANEGGVVFFPPGRYRIGGGEGRRDGIRVSRGRIVLQGSGAGDGGSELFMEEMRPGRRPIQFRPRDRSDDQLAIVTSDAPREGFSVEVDDPSQLEVGQNVVMQHQSEEFTRLYFDPLPLAREWRRLYGRRGGMRIAEIHTIAEIDGNRVRFVNPIHFQLRRVESEPFTLHRYESLRECGLEDLRFTGNWNSYPEEFVHHKDRIHDSGWVALGMENVENCWIRRCEFRDWNECIFTRNAYKMTNEDVAFSGKKGHTSVHARSGYGTLIKNCLFAAGHHHGPGGGYGSVNLVVTQCRMQRDQNIDLHSGQSYACLYDDIEGGIFRNLGGPHPGLPHAGRDLVFWNFRHRSTDDFHYDFWSTTRRRNHTFAYPTFVGFQADRNVSFENEGRNEMPGTMVAPRSLFEAQLELRLRKST